jgi:hypothetical protein
MGLGMGLWAYGGRHVGTQESVSLFFGYTYDRSPRPHGPNADWRLQDVSCAIVGSRVGTIPGAENRVRLIIINSRFRPTILP